MDQYYSDALKIVLEAGEVSLFRFFYDVKVYYNIKHIF